MARRAHPRVTGIEGNLVFSYAADDAFIDFNKALAVGARLDISVIDAELREPAQIVSAVFDNEDVLSVDVIDAHTITVLATAEGGSLLSIEAFTSSSETLTDAVNLRAAMPDTLDIRHSCHSQPEAHYLTGTRAWVPYEMLLGRQPTIGYGYYPIELSDPALGSLISAASNQQYMVIDTTAPGELVLQSQVDDTSMTLNIVGPEFIDGAMEPIAFVLEDIDVGDTNIFYVLPRVGATPICQSTAPKSVASDTPDVCDVRDRDNPSLGGDLAYEAGWFEVEGVAEGSCLFTVTYPDGDNGQGASQQFSYPSSPKPYTPPISACTTMVSRCGATQSSASSTSVSTDTDCQAGAPNRKMLIGPGSSTGGQVKLPASLFVQSASPMLTSTLVTGSPLVSSTSTRTPIPIPSHSLLQPGPAATATPISATCRHICSPTRGAPARGETIGPGHQPAATPSRADLVTFWLFELGFDNLGGRLGAHRGVVEELDGHPSLFQERLPIEAHSTDGARHRG